MFDATFLKGHWKNTKIQSLHIDSTKYQVLNIYSNFKNRNVKENKNEKNKIFRTKSSIDEW